MEEEAYAKINLALHVRERRPDGYHRIETIFAFAEQGDRLSAVAGEGLSLAVEGPLPPLWQASPTISSCGRRGRLRSAMMSEKARG